MPLTFALFIRLRVCSTILRLPVHVTTVGDLSKCISAKCGRSKREFAIVRHLLII